MNILTKEQMQKYDRLATEAFGIPSILLMENAGRNVADRLSQFIKENELYFPRVVVVCGPGNNGGDGFCAARFLNNGENCQLRLLQLVPDRKYKGDAETNRLIAEKLEIPCLKLYGDTDEDILKVKKELKKADIIVDAILGTGLKGKVSGFLGEVIDIFRELVSAYVIAVDLPSGMDADTGAVLGRAVRAHETVTFGYPKVGLLMDNAIDYVGKLHITDISLPKRIEEIEPPFIESATLGEISALLPERPSNAHKGMFGHLLVVGGSQNLRGAPILAARAALSSGVGLVTLASIPSVTAAAVAETPDIMVHDLLEKDGYISSNSIEEIIKLMEGKTALVLGCGIGSGEGVKDIIGELLRKVKAPILIDADGLNALAKSLTPLKEAKSSSIVLTPHPGEMGRLCATSAAEVQEDRLKTAIEFVQSYPKVTLTLKGAHTIIASPEGKIAVNQTGGPGMAVGGMGDVLAGVGGAMMAQGLSPYDALRVGCFVCGLAGELVTAQLSEESVTASEVIRKLAEAIVLIKKDIN